MTTGFPGYPQLVNRFKTGLFTIPNWHGKSFSNTKLQMRVSHGLGIINWHMGEERELISPAIRGHEL